MGPRRFGNVDLSFVANFTMRQGLHIRVPVYGRVGGLGTIESGISIDPLQKHPERGPAMAHEGFLLR